MTGDIRETAIDHVAGEKIATFFSSETRWINQIWMQAIIARLSSAANA